ncbi:prolipoprotein diacylglyceryl transferase [Mycobacteroides abscessus]|uniref:hypothetical protein n=1 Tax=Mycobacteroides abscessus TaxID=36809 RepID=UPI00092AD105|nr:hypothetical protein [Mycobacteroides abscessus]MDO3333776.1 hypothetical protein [Mycobacteroides abscessus subsp. bolletii]QSM86995.1 hypothetical protein I3U44_13925 [Mycobacteroides abscessus subsp. bolletii]SHP21222.1 Uncharacterised protein [Mycobacteroides abscessus subsp. bolletii]SHR57487.1 Uncharacterised protein [Mycobacteroides abscessus subsp. bolletii]SHS26446.1 Uncharacterised protein [Mycobacteroides abscessus subsp. bolletii]
MDRTANPLFKAGMAAITATALIVAPAVTPPTRQSISLPDIRSASVRLSSLAFTSRPAEVPASPLAALKLSLSPASAASASPLKRAPLGQLATAVQPRAAAAPLPTPVSAPTQPDAATASSPVLASSLTNGIDQAYQFIQYWVDYGVDLAQWGAGFVPVIGGLVSAQIGIVYDNLVRPIANSFVYNLVDPILNDPSFSNIVNSFGRFGSDIVNSVINFAWAEARYFLPPLPPLPGLALQTTTDANGAAPTSVHEALVPFTKAFKDAEAHFAEALGLTKPDPKSAALEKTGTAAQTGESLKETTGESVQEEGKTAETGAATGTKEALDRKESAEGKASANDKATAVADKTKAGDKATTESREPVTTATEAAKESTKDSVKDAAVPGVAADSDAASGNLTKGTLAAKETGNQQQSATDGKPSPSSAPADKPDKPVKPKVPAASTTEHGSISAQGIVRGPVSQSTSGQSGPSASTPKTADSKVSSSGATGFQTSDTGTPESKMSDTKTATGTTAGTKATETKPKATETKPSDAKSSGSTTSGMKSPGTTAHDSANKPSASASSAAKSGGEGSKSSSGSHR